MFFAFFDFKTYLPSNELVRKNNEPVYICFTHTYDNIFRYAHKLYKIITNKNIPNYRTKSTNINSLLYASNYSTYYHHNTYVFPSTYVKKKKKQFHKYLHNKLHLIAPPPQTYILHVCAQLQIV